MATTLHLSREVKVYIEWDGQIWEIPVLDGFSFSQATNTTEVTIKEMAASNVSRRGRSVFNDSLSPAEWSFSTYARPTLIVDKHHAVEEVLWAMAVGAAAADYPGDAPVQNDVGKDWTTSLETTTSSLDINFDSSNKLVFDDASIYFMFPANDAGGSEADLWYKISGATVNEVSIEFDIDGITTINWSGMGTTLTESAAIAANSIRDKEIVTSHLVRTDNFIRNRLTTLTLTGADSGSILASYAIVLTGGNITITNNVEHATPASLGVVNVPFGHTMGTRSVSGNFTCYLDNSGTASADLWQDLQASTSVTRNSFGLTFGVGGGSAPRMEVTCAKAMLEVPVHSVADVISMEVAFHGLGSDIGDTDEVLIKYVGN